MNRYLPEGCSPHPAPYTPEELKLAMFSGEILEGTAVKCDENHNLLVDLGCSIGRIPQDETAIGIREGTLRDIAILSKVGKPVCFQVTELPDDGIPVLSRRAAQEEARDVLLHSRRPGDILPAVVLNLTAFGAFCDVGCGVPALMGIQNISVSRISHSKDRFREGQHIFAVLRHLDPVQGRIFLSHRELLGTWEENAACFRPGQTVTGFVRSVKEYGAFVELLPNLSGLADPNPSLREGDAVTVYIKSILPEKQKIKLVAIQRLEPGSLPLPKLTYHLTEGHLDRWVYAPGQITVF